MIGSRTTIHREIVPVHIEKTCYDLSDYNSLFIEIPVEVEYIIDREVSHSEDPGGRGTVREEIMVLDASICPGRLLLGDLTSDDVAGALTAAKRKVEER